MSNNQMRQCKACGKDIAKGVKKCVHCGKDQRNFFMRHKIFTGILAIIVLVIAVNVGGGDSEQAADTGKEVEAEEKSNDSDNESANAGENDDTEEAEGNNNNGNEEDETKTEELNQEIADDDNVKITLVEVERTEGNMFEEAGYEVLFDIDNKRDETIEVQAREMSIDGKMVEDFDYSMSTEISGGKEADADLTIGGIMAEDEIPEVEDEIEFQLHVLDWEDIEFKENYDVLIEFD